MNKTAKILVLVLAAFVLIIGMKSYQHSKPYAQLTDMKSINGTISQLHCPPKGAASLSLNNSDATYNLSVKFRSDYCTDKKSQVLVGKTAFLETIEINERFSQVYKLNVEDKLIISPEEIEADQSSSTFGLFFLAFFLIALVAYKSRAVKNK
jgi:hypothetical protein